MSIDRFILNFRLLFSFFFIPTILTLILYFNECLECSGIFTVKYLNSLRSHFSNGFRGNYKQQTNARYNWNWLAKPGLLKYIKVCMLFFPSWFFPFCVPWISQSKFKLNSRHLLQANSEPKTVFSVFAHKLRCYISFSFVFIFNYVSLINVLSSLELSDEQWI